MYTARPTITVNSQPATEKKYWKTYVTCLAIVGMFGLLNIVASVQSMYSTNTNVEAQYQKQELTATIQQLEKEQATLSNLNNLHALATANGYTTISDLKYAAAPVNQVVAQR